MRRYMMAVFLLLLLLPLQAQSEQIIKESIVSQGEERTVYLFVPDRVSSSAPAPLILLLHGSGRGGLSLMVKWQDLASREGIILAAPDAAELSHWSLPEDGPELLRDITESIKARYPANPRRVYLFGHSAGGIFALYLSLLEPEYFAATAVHAGALRKDGEPLLDYGSRKIPIAIIVGTEDELFPLSIVRATRDSLIMKGFPVTVTEMRGHNHWYYDLAPEINTRAWKFLQKHELPEEAKYREYSRWLLLKQKAGLFIVLLLTALLLIAALVWIQIRRRREKNEASAHSEFHV